ncbi:unnamed protein product, partial [Scytosiphon promiscuus]
HPRPHASVAPDSNAVSNNGHNPPTAGLIPIGLAAASEAVAAGAAKAPGSGGSGSFSFDGDRLAGNVSGTGSGTKSNAAGTAVVGADPSVFPVTVFPDADGASAPPAVFAPSKAANKIGGGGGGGGSGGGGANGKKVSRKVPANKADERGGEEDAALLEGDGGLVRGVVSHVSALMLSASRAAATAVAAPTVR